MIAVGEYFLVHGHHRLGQTGGILYLATLVVMIIILVWFVRRV